MNGRKCIEVLQEWAEEAFLIGDWDRFRALMLDVLILNLVVSSEN